MEEEKGVQDPQENQEDLKKEVILQRKKCAEQIEEILDGKEEHEVALILLRALENNYSLVPLTMVYVIMRAANGSKLIITKNEDNSFTTEIIGTDDEPLQLGYTTDEQK